MFKVCPLKTIMGDQEQEKEPDKKER